MINYECIALNETALSHPHPKAQGITGHSGWKECRSWRMERKALRCCLQDTTHCTHELTSRCGSLQKTLTDQVRFQHGWGGADEAHP